MDFLVLKRRTMALIKRFRGGIAPERYDDLLEMVEAGEPGVALEIYCSNLDDLDAVLPEDVIEEIEALAGVMNLDPEWWDRLRELGKRLETPEIARRTRALIERFTNALSPEQRAVQLEMVEAGEPAIAMQDLCEALRRSRSPVPREAMREIETLGRALDLEPDSLFRLKSAQRALNDLH